VPNAIAEQAGKRGTRKEPANVDDDDPGSDNGDFGRDREARTREHGGDRKPGLGIGDGEQKARGKDGVGTPSTCSDNGGAVARWTVRLPDRASG
jgi:hypothetical protein